MKFDYFYDKQADQFSFVRIPKVLLGKKFLDLSTDSKLLYGVLLDRMSLSMKNGWKDEKHRVYIIYEIKEIMKNFEISKSTAVKWLQDLEKCGLVEKKKRGLGRPDLIYVKNFIEKGVEDSYLNENRDDTFKRIKNKLQEVQEDEPQEVQEDKSQEVQENAPLISKTNINNTDNNDTESKSSHIISSKHVSRADELRGLEDTIKANIEYERLKKEYSQYIEMIEGLYDLILEIFLSNRETIHIARDIFPIEIVRAKFFKLKYGHIVMVLENLKRYSNRMVDKKKYLLATLFNAPSAFCVYNTKEYSNEKKMQKIGNEKNKISTQIEQWDYDFDELERLLVTNN